MKIEHNIIITEKNKRFQIPVIIEFNERLSNKEIEDLKISASKGIAMLYSSKQLIKHEDNILFNGKKEVYPLINLDKIKGDIKDIDFDKLKNKKLVKVIKYKVISKE